MFVVMGYLDTFGLAKNEAHQPVEAVLLDLLRVHQVVFALLVAYCSSRGLAWCLPAAATAACSAATGFVDAVLAGTPLNNNGVSIRFHRVQCLKMLPFFQKMWFVKPMRFPEASALSRLRNKQVVRCVSMWFHHVRHHLASYQTEL